MPYFCCYSVSELCPTLCNPWTAVRWVSCPSLSTRVCWSSCPLSQWCHPTISFSVALFSSCLQSFPASRSFPMSRLFIPSGQSIRASASASVLPWIFSVDFLYDWLVWSPCSRRDSQESSPAPQFESIKFFGAQPSLWYNSHIRTRLLEKP